MYETAQELAYKMRLFGVQQSIERRCAEALAESLHPGELIRLILEDELLDREVKKTKRLNTRAKFRRQCDLENWDSEFKRGITKAKFKELSLLNFFHKKQNLILLGATGLGKTHLAISLGKALCQSQKSVRFYSMNRFFEEAQKDKAAGKYLNFVDRCKKIEVIIFDDFGLRNYEHSEASILLDVVEERAGHGALIITSQTNPDGWYEIFEDSVISQAIVDRLINPSETVILKGKSYRENL